MTLVLPGLIASILYLAGAGIQFSELRSRTPSRRIAVLLLGLGGLLLHGYVTYQEIYTETGVNLSLLPMVSLMFLAVTALVLASSLRRPVENLMIALFPLAAISVVLSIVFHEGYTPRVSFSQGFVAHIILSVIAYGLLTLAAIQAGLLSFGDYELRHRRLSIMKSMPPLQTMEGLLFEMLWAGLVFLSLSIATGFVYMGNREEPAEGLVHHTVITLAAWIVFAILLWGRHQLGWRGQTASRWTLSGFALLVLGYFGSKFVLEVLLGRA